MPMNCILAYGNWSNYTYTSAILLVYKIVWNASLWLALPYIVARLLWKYHFLPPMIVLLGCAAIQWIMLGEVLPAGGIGPYPIAFLIVVQILIPLFYINSIINSIICILQRNFKLKSSETSEGQGASIIITSRRIRFMKHVSNVIDGGLMVWIILAPWVLTGHAYRS